MYFSILIGIVKFGRSLIYFKVKCYNFKMTYLSLEIVFTLANSIDPYCSLSSGSTLLLYSLKLPQIVNPSPEMWKYLSD